MPDFLNTLLSPGSFIPHGHCYLWQTPLVWLHILSDGLITAAYYSIPVALIYLTSKRRDLPYPWVFGLFSAFIISCGTTHWLEVVTLWYPVYWLTGVVKAITALVSLWTALTLFPLLPQIVALPSPEQLRLINAQLKQEIQERKEVEVALRESERRYATLAEAVPVAIFRFNQSGDCIYVNNRWAEMTGRPVEAAMGKGLSQTIHPEDRDRMAEEWFDWMHSPEREECFKAEARAERPDSSIIWYYCRIKPELTPDGTLVGYVGSLTDISTRKQVEQDLRKSEALLKEAEAIAHVGSWEFEVSTGKVTWSDETFRIFGLTPNQPEPSYEQHLEHNYPVEDQQRLHEAVTRVLKHGESYELDLSIIRADGSVGWILGKGKPILDAEGRVIRLFGIALDITERKRAEAEQQKLDQMKDDFLSTVSHELRTPLTSIKMSVHMLELVLDRLLPPSNELANPQTAVPASSSANRVKQYLDILRNQCEQELSLVNDLLELQRLEAQTAPLEIEEIDLNNWLPHILEPYYGRAHARNQVLEVDNAPELPHLVSNQEVLTRIVNELLTNACKHTPPSGIITVQVETAEGALSLTVKNSGVTIPADELEHIFDRFYRIPHSDRWNQGGTGLGLALVERQVHRLGGSIEVVSETNTVQFVVQLPLHSRCQVML